MLVSSPRRTLFMFLCYTDGVIKNWQKYFKYIINLAKIETILVIFLVTLQSCIFPNLSTNMVINHCTFDNQSFMIHHLNQNFTADAKMYHTWLYDKCTMIYDHICTQFWRSLSAVGHGNVILKSVDLASRVRSRPAQRDSMQ